MNISVLKAALINVYKGKALPEGHISTRSDGSQWKKSGKKWKLHKAAPKAKKPKAETKKKPEEKKPAIRSKMAPPKNMDDMVKWAKDQGKDFQNVENLAREYNKAKAGESKPADKKEPAKGKPTPKKEEKGKPAKKEEKKPETKKPEKKESLPKKDEKPKK